MEKDKKLVNRQAEDITVERGRFKGSVEVKRWEGEGGVRQC